MKHLELIRRDNNNNKKAIKIEIKNNMSLTQRKALDACCTTAELSLKKRPPVEADGDTTAILLFNCYNKF